MELTVHKGSILAYQGSLDTSFEMPIETEIVVPDYIAEVFKIVKCTVTHTIFQKSLISGKILVEGFHKVMVFYQTETGNALYELEQKLPFSKSFDYRGAPSACQRISVTGQSEYLNCRAINQRRIDIRGAYSMTVNVVPFDSEEVSCAISGDSVEQKLEDINYTRYLATVDKQFTTEAPVDFYEQPSTILYTLCSGNVISTDIVGEKLIIKGEAKINIAYLSQECSYIKEVKTLSLNQVIDMDGDYIDPLVCADIEVSNCTILSGNEDEGLAISVTCNASARLYGKCNQLTVAGAFSTKYNYDVTYTDMDILTGGELINSEINASVTAPLGEDFVGIIDCFAATNGVMLNNTGACTTLTGSALIHLICENDLGELYCYDSMCEFRIPTIGTLTADSVYDIVTTVQSATPSVLGKDVTVELVVSANGIVCEKQTLSVLDNIEISQTPIEQDGAALCIYFAREGEAVFDIAQRYRASPDDIMNHNNLTDDVLKQKQRLIVPV